MRRRVRDSVLNLLSVSLATVLAAGVGGFSNYVGANLYSNADAKVDAVESGLKGFAVIFSVFFFLVMMGVTFGECESPLREWKSEDRTRQPSSNSSAEEKMELVRREVKPRTTCRQKMGILLLFAGFVSVFNVIAAAASSLFSRHDSDEAENIGFAGLLVSTPLMMLVWMLFVTLLIKVQMPEEGLGRIARAVFSVDLGSFWPRRTNPMIEGGDNSTLSGGVDGYGAMSTSS